MLRNWPWTEAGTFRAGVTEAKKAVHAPKNNQNASKDGKTDEHEKNTNEAKAHYEKQTLAESEVWKACLAGKVFAWEKPWGTARERG